ncbi:MAG: hypothetical protein Q9225_003077 [Loekoesia sp. 1 TL-2023]
MTIPLTLLLLSVASGLFSFQAVSVLGSGLSLRIPTPSLALSSAESYPWQNTGSVTKDETASGGDRSSVYTAASYHTHQSPGVMSDFSSAFSRTAHITSAPAEETTLGHSPALQSSAPDTSKRTVSSHSLLGSQRPPSSPPLVTMSLPTTSLSSELLQNSTGMKSHTPAPASTGGVSRPSSTLSKPTSAPALATTLAPLPSVTLPPSGINIAPSGTTASSDGVIFGGLLFSLSATIHGIDLTIPTIKAQIQEDVENTINKASDLFDDLGGTDSKGSCDHTSKLKRLSNPFSGLENLAGDMTKIIGCADEVLNTLKDNLDKDTPDPELIDDLLEDLGTLAGETDPDDKPTKSAPKSTASNTSNAKSNSSPPSSALSSTSPTSDSLSSITVGSCGGCCPTDVPALPTTGTPAVTAPPTDSDTLDKRVAPGRLQRLVKRKPAASIPRINNCVLQTPNNWPVTTPAYPGGFEFYTLDTLGALGTLTAVSRYYRSTTTGAPACTPTITQIDAAQWTFKQSGKVPENDKVSVDHAYEIHFLKSFVESIIDKTDGISCKDANAQFFDSGSCPANRLEPIFGSLPSFSNPDFVAMSQWLNGDAKGWVSGDMLKTLDNVLGDTYDPNLGGANLPGNKVRQSDDWQSAMKKITNKMRLAQILVGAALIINADNTVAQMQKTNNRIYAAFKNHDTYLSQNPGLPRANFGWASKYKTYMDDYVNYRNGASARLLPNLLATIGADLNVANNNVRGKVQSEWDQWSNLHNSMTAYYGAHGPGASDLNWAIKWEWDTNNVKRDEIDEIFDKRQACSRPITSRGDVSDLTATPSSTPIPSGSPMDTTTTPTAASSSSMSAAPVHKSTGFSPGSTISAPFSSIISTALVATPVHSPTDSTPESTHSAPSSGTSSTSRASIPAYSSTDSTPESKNPTISPDISSTALSPTPSKPAFSCTTDP